MFGRSYRAEQTHLKKPGEDVKLKHRDVVVAGEVYCGLEGHGLQARADWVKLVQSLSEDLPLDDSPAKIRAAHREYGQMTVILFFISQNKLMIFQHKHSLVPKGSSPEFCCISLRDPEIVPLEQTVGKDGFQLSQHVTED